MAEGRGKGAGKGMRWWVLPLVVLVVWGLARGGKDDGGEPSAGPSATPSPSASSPSAPGHGQDDPDGGGKSGSSSTRRSDDPARYAPQVRKYAAAAGVSPRLVMAILYNEAYKPHDPELERSWQRMKPDAAFGIANMHRAAFEATRRGRDFADRRWDELPDDRDLAIEAAAWHLHDLAAQLGDRRGGGLNKNELLALGYNAGASNMLAFARGASPGSQAASYLDKLRGNWDKAAEALDR